MGDADREPSATPTLRQQSVAAARDFGVVLSAISAVLVGLWALLGAHLNALASLPDIQRDVQSIIRVQQTDVEPSVQFFGEAHPYPVKSTAPGRRLVAYNVRRNENCSGVITVRYWNLAQGSYDPKFTRQVAVQAAPVTDRFHLWRLPLDVPDLPPGVWAYHPELQPGPDCTNDETGPMPPAYFTVLPDPSLIE
jgi:hypothetical protein